MINRVVLVGRMTRDPELRRTPQGDAVTSFTLAVNRNFTSGDGQRQADFINCVVSVSYTHLCSTQKNKSLS